MLQSILTAAIRRISSVTWAEVFRVVLLDTWPMMVDRVLMSIPCSNEAAAKV